MLLSALTAALALTLEAQLPGVTQHEDQPCLVLVPRPEKSDYVLAGTGNSFTVKPSEVPTRLAEVRNVFPDARVLRLSLESAQVTSKQIADAIDAAKTA